VDRRKEMTEEIVGRYIGKTEYHYLKCDNCYGEVNTLIPVETLEYNIDTGFNELVKRKWCKGCIHKSD
jgi:hypothetical protein